MKWQSVFQDETLQSLIKEALTNNYDMRIAAARILQASANLGITRANQFPTVNGSFAITNQQATPLCYRLSHLRHGAIAAELHRRLLGTIPPRHRGRARDPAGDRYARDVVQTTLISLVATAYFLLRQYDTQLTYRKRRLTATRTS